MNKNTTDFLDPEVNSNGKRLESREEITPEMIARIVRDLPSLDGARLETLQKYSAISPEVIYQRGYRRIDNPANLKWLGFSEKHGPGILIPIRGIGGEIVSCQVRFDTPVDHLDPKTQKKKKLRYLSPSGLDQRVDFPREIPEDGEIWITEGVKKADSLRSKGVCAFGLTGVTTWYGRSAQKDFRSIDWTDREILLCFDSDASTNNYVQNAETKLAAFLKGLGAFPKIVRLEPAPDGTKQGVDDFFANGGTLEELFDKIQEPKEITASDELDAAEHLDAEENLIFAGQKFWRYSESEGVWLEVPDEMIKRGLQVICRDAGRPIKDSFVRGAFNQAKARFFRPVEFDRTDPRSIPAANGILRFIDGRWELSSYRREDYRRIRLPVVWNPKAKCLRFEKFLEEVFEPANEEGRKDARQKILAILEFIGLSLTATTEFETALLMVGKGGNGKSVLIKVVEGLVGGRNRSAVQMKQLENRFQRAHLDGKIINLMTELPEGAEIPDAELKAIISGEPITAEHKMKPPFEFYPIAKLWIATNHMPSTRDLSDGHFRRFTILQFENRFDNRPDRDTQLPAKLIAESSGILNYVLKALEGVFLRGSLTKPDSSIKALEEWRKDADQVAQFIEEEAVLEPGAFIPSSVLYEKYFIWAKTSGIRKFLGKKNFTQRLQNFGVTAGKDSSGNSRGLYGIRLSGGCHGTF